MTLRQYARRLADRGSLQLLKLREPKRETFECPVCWYEGPFLDVHAPTGTRKHAKCPNCGALERHRIQLLVLEQVLSGVLAPNLKILHFAPEPFMQKFFSTRFGSYESADLSMGGVDHNVDLQNLPFKAETYDFVFASHVLEHIRDDHRALSEVRRVLKPGGIAILPVPIVADKTIEYPEPNPNEFYHVRAPGLDYFARYELHFRKVDQFTSELIPAKHQPFIYEDRTRWPTTECPLRPAMLGERHIDIVPVCYT